MKYVRCINCDGIDIKLAYSRKKKRLFTKCNACNWVNKYLEELQNGS